LKVSIALVVCLLALSSAGSAATTRSSPPLAEVVVTLDSPSLAIASLHPHRFGLSSFSKTAAANLHSLAGRNYLERLSSLQAVLSHRIEEMVSGASVRWHYRVVANGLAVTLPAAEVESLARVPGVAHVYPSYRYRPLAGQRVLAGTPPTNVSLIGAPELWGPDLASAGQGIKIGIIDDGIDQTHPYFDPAGFTMPAGYPKGNSAYTTAKVIVARAFPAPGQTDASAALPFDPRLSSHATHVAGIAAGDADTVASYNGDTVSLSGVAPRAYLGNYRAMTIPTSNVGLNGNSPELVAAIEAAVSDGMNVINLSLGEAEIDPRNDIVAQALNAASDAGVVVAVVAGNEFEENGEGSIDSPGSAKKAITVAASTSGGIGSKPDVLAGFSSSGPTAFGLLLKPDVSAPGADILSSVPVSDGSWDEESGTSMAAPHVAGAAALLLQRHPTWTVAQIKSALVSTGAPVTAANGRETSPLREGGGRIALQQADQPLVFASPSSVSFGFLERRHHASRTIAISDGGGLVGSCRARIRPYTSLPGTSLSVPSSVSVPGSIALTARAGAEAAEGNLDGWLILTCAGAERRIPYWLRVSVPQLGRKKATTLFRAGVYQGDTSLRTALVDSYRYPERAPDVQRVLRGPEQVFRLRLARSIENFGVVIISHARGVVVSPRIVRDTNEGHLAGLTALPLNVNPYMDTFGNTEPVAAVLRPGPGSYDIVFDTTSRKASGRFRFRLWINDRTRPRLRLLARKANRITLRITDGGAGVDPSSVSATVGSTFLKTKFDSLTGEATIDLTPLKAGVHTLVVRASDYQESKNDENVAALLPNTGELRISVSKSAPCLKPARATTS
jgi:subtilisin family serine protease